MALTILVIDDEERVLSAFARNIRMIGHTVYEALGGQAGLELYYQTQPDVVLTDLRMPDPDGLKVLQAIRQHDPEANVILFSGHGNQDAILAAMRAGASDFLPKPVDQVMIETVLRRAEERCHLKRKLRASQEALCRQNALLEETIRARTAELEETLAKYRVLFDAFPLGITIAAADGQILEANRESERLLGVSAAEHRERSIDGAEWRIIRPDGSPMPPEEFASVRALQEQQLIRNVEMGIVKGADDVTWISVTAAPLNDARVVITYNDVTERKQAQDALHKNLERYRKAQQLGRVGNWEYNLQTTEFWGSEEAKRIYGFDPATEWFTTEEVEQCIPERERVHQALVDLIERGQEYDLEFDILTHDTGERRTIISKAELERDANGIPLKVSGVIQDITDRKQMEAALRESAARYRLIADNTTDVIWTMDAEGRFTYVSPSTERLFGYTAQEWQFLDWAEVVPPAYLETVNAAFEKLRCGCHGQHVQETIQVRRKDSRLLWVEFTATALCEPEGKFAGVVGVTRDVTERKQAEAALLHERERLDNILAALETGLVLLNSDLTIAWVNRKIREMFPHAEPEGQFCYRFYEGRDTPCENCGVQRAFQTGEVTLHERQNPFTGRWYTLIAQPIRDEQGHVSQVLESITDITKHKALELQLQAYAANLEALVNQKVQELERERAQVIQAGKRAMIGELATSVAHELNQPLTSLLLDADYLEALAQRARSVGPEHLIAPEVLLEVAEHQHHDIARCRRIVDHLRAFGRIPNEPPTRINLNDVLADTFILIEQRLRQNSITVVQDLAPELPLVLAHPQKMEQVFLNLISNAEHALQAMAQRVRAGEVDRPGYQKILHLHTYTEEQDVCVAIHDNGCGMTPEQQAHLFEPFFTTKPVGEGTGLGLSICCNIVAEFGGEITCETVPNEGTTFTIRLPRAEK